MNALQRAIDALRHPAEYPHQRARRRWLATLAQNEPVQQARPTIARVQIVCRCNHTRDAHLIASAAEARCDESCDCSIFRADRVLVTQ